MTKWKEFAEMFGLELEEEFKIVENGRELGVFKITSDDGVLIYNTGKACFVKSLAPKHYISNLIDCSFTVKKLPQEPKVGESFWFLTGTLEVHETLNYYHENSYESFLILKSNWFKTKEDAEHAARQVEKLLVELKEENEPPECW